MPYLNASRVMIHEEALYENIRTFTFAVYLLRSY